MAFATPPDLPDDVAEPSAEEPALRKPGSARLGHPVTALLVAAVAGVGATAWAAYWLWLELRRWNTLLLEQLTDKRGEVAAADWVPLGGVPLRQAVDFGILAAGLVLLAWLLGARTGLGPRRAPALVAAVEGLWTLAAIALFALPQAWPAWPGFSAPVEFGDDGLVELAPSVPAFAGPVVIVLLSAAAAWLGSRATPPAPRPRHRAGSWFAAVGVALGLGAYVAVIAWVWQTTDLGPWSATQLVEWPFVALVLTVLVAWAVSGKGEATSALVALAATMLLWFAVFGSQAMATSVLLIPLGLLTVVAAATHRQLGETLHRLVV